MATKKVTVKWKIDIETESFQKAASEALSIQRDRNSTATYFTLHHPVTDEKVAIVDIEEDYCKPLKPGYFDN